jgi:hypothetical protein
MRQRRAHALSANQARVIAPDNSADAAHNGEIFFPSSSDDSQVGAVYYAPASTEPGSRLLIVF